MKAQINKQEKIRQIGSGSIIFGAGMSAFIGVLLAMLSLILTPVENGKPNMKPEEIKIGKAYYIAGSSRDGNAHSSKRRQFVGTSTVVLHHGELNTWASRSFKPSPDLQKAEPYPPVISPLTPNFRISDGNVQIATELFVSSIPKRRPIYQAQGSFVKGSDKKYKFIVESSSINQMAVPRIPGMQQAFFDKLANGYIQSDEGQELAAAWNKLKNVEVKGDKIRLAF